MLDLIASLLVALLGVLTHGVEPDHPALDIACVVGRPVRASHDGVGRSRWSGTLGWTFQLNGDAVQTRYSHLSAAAPAGSYLRGQIIGLCGDTGSWSTGPHLHFEAKPVHLLHSLDRLSAEQLDQLESHPLWLNQLREARR